jgi:protein TonB
MKTGIRIIVALLVSILLELAFIELTKSIYQPQPKEVSEVIKISLIKPQNQRIRVEKKIGKKRRRKKVHPKFTPKKANLTSKRPLNKVPRERKEKVVSSGGLKAFEGNLPLSYLEAIRRAIEENIFYPLEAIENGEEGRVLVGFVLNRSGKVVECKSLRGKSKILKEATCIAIRRANFPPIPKSIKNKKLKFQLEIEYNLDTLH